MEGSRMLFADRLLVVDDEPYFAEIAAHVGLGQGYDVRCVRTARDFKAQFQEFLPLTVVVDVIVPDEDGVQLIMWLNKSPYRPRIILVTGYNKLYLDVVKALGVSGGANVIATLSKPISIDDLRATLRPPQVVADQTAA
jgi:two-component system, OmpR family, response regulator